MCSYQFEPQWAFLLVDGGYSKEDMIEKRNCAPSHLLSLLSPTFHFLQSQRALVGNASQSRRDFYTELIADEEHRCTQVKQGD